MVILAGLRCDSHNIRQGREYHRGMKCLIAIAVLLLAGPLLAAAEENFFPITPWEVPWNKGTHLDDVVNGIASLRECGYTAAAFPRAEQISECEKAGLRVIVALPQRQRKWRELSDAKIAETVQTLVGQTAGSDSVLGYFLMDEPGAEDFAALGKAVAQVKKLAPGKLAYINLFPDYATLGAPDISQLGTASYGEYLDRYINEVKPQFISYDNYKVEFSHDLADAKQAESYFRNLLTIRAAALKHDLPFWNIVSSNQIRPGMPVPSPANLLLQAYTTLAAGAKGLTWYTYYDRGYRYAPIDRDGHRSATWSYVRMVNEQVKVLGPILKPLKSEGVYFTSPALAESLPVLPGKVITAVQSDPQSPAMIGEFSGTGGQKFVMIVNLNLQRSAKFAMTANVTGAMQRISPVDRSKSAVEESALWLPAGQGALLEVPR